MPEYLTEEERVALDLSAKLANSLRKVIGDGPQAANDWSEAAAKIHELQHMVMAQVAARVYPEEFRLLGNVGTWVSEPTVNPRVVKRLESGDWSFGHRGEHHGSGTEECPRDLHHHHDEFCVEPTRAELRAAGIDPKEFRARSRR